MSFGAPAGRYVRHREEERVPARPPVPSTARPDSRTDVMPTSRYAAMTSTERTRRAAVLAATLGVAAAAWVIVARRMSGMDMGPATDLGSFSFYAAVWVPMMAAMMLPGAVPAVSRFVRAN